MSEEINDKIDYIMAQKLGYSKMTKELEVLGQLSGFTSGPEMDFFTAQRMKKMSYRTMSPADIFLDTVIKRDKKKFSITDEEFVFLTTAAYTLPYIQYKNPGGILYAYRYYKLIRDELAKSLEKTAKKSSGSKVSVVISTSEIENKLKNLLSQEESDSEDSSVPLFDIFRYYRLLVEYELFEDITLKIPVSNFPKIKIDFVK